MKGLETVVRKVKLSHLTVSKTKLYFAMGTWTVEEVLDELGRRNILSVPVFEEKSGKRGKYLGLISISDITQALAFNPWLNKFEEGIKNPTSMTKVELENAVNYSVLKNKVQTLLGMTTEGKDLWLLDDADTLIKAIKIFSTGTHRALVTRKIGPCMLSQTDLVRFIAGEISGKLTKDLEKVVSQPITSFGLVPKEKKMVTCKDTDTALHAFRLLLQYKNKDEYSLRSIPVLDAKNKLVCSISESDLRSINSKTLLSILKPIPEYLKELHKMVRIPVVVGPKTSLKDTIIKVVSNKIHRLWIVDADDALLGVVSLTDILGVFTKAAEQFAESKK